jgi:hypothetical protein
LESTQAKTTRKHAGSAVKNIVHNSSAPRACVCLSYFIRLRKCALLYSLFFYAPGVMRFSTHGTSEYSNLFYVTICSFFISLMILVQVAQSRSFPSGGGPLIYCQYLYSPLNSSPTPGVFYTYFYNHAHRPRLEKLLYLQWSFLEAPTDFFKYF